MAVTRRHMLQVLAGGAALSLSNATAVLAQERFPGLRAGGHAIYFRHAATQWSGIDSIDWPRERQRLLSDEGIRQAEAIGAAFRTLGIPVGEVWSSPFARCEDHALLAFGRAQTDMRLIGLLSDRDGRAERTEFLRSLVTTPPPAGTNTVIVAHRSNIAALVDVALEEGEGLVLRPTGTGEFEAIGRAMPDQWM